MRILGTVLISALMASTAIAQNVKPEAEVLHWFTTGAAAAALKVFATNYENAGGEWIDNAVASGEAARAVAVNRMAGGEPPSAMMLNIGRQFDDMVAQGLLSPIDVPAQKASWETNAVGVIKEAVTRDGHIYGAPTNINGQNWLFYNEELFKKVGAPVPDTWKHFFEAADKLKAGGVIPLAVGAQAWQISLIFNDVLVGLGGRELYMQVYSERSADAIKSPAFREVVDTVVKLREYQDPGSPNREWNVAANMVQSGQAAMHIHGDWTQSEFKAAGWDGYGCLLGPGKPAFIMGGDMFVFPKLPGNASEARVKGQELLAEIMLSAEAQSGYNASKSSVPSRVDVDVTGADKCKAQALKAMADPNVPVPSENFLLLPDASGALQELQGELWAGTVTPEAFIERFATTIAQAE